MQFLDLKKTFANFWKREKNALKILILNLIFYQLFFEVKGRYLLI